jgi:hypothetical protein
MMSSRSPSAWPARTRSPRGLVLLLAALATFSTCLTNKFATMPAFASQCPSASQTAASRTRWAAVRKQLVTATDHDMACRIFAASFYESALARQAAVACAHAADLDPDVSALDSEINAFNDLLAAKCGG